MDQIVREAGVGNATVPSVLGASGPTGRGTQLTRQLGTAACS